MKKTETKYIPAGFSLETGEILFDEVVVVVESESQTATETRQDADVDDMSTWVINP